MVIPVNKHILVAKYTLCDMIYMDVCVTASPFLAHFFLPPAAFFVINFFTSLCPTCLCMFDFLNVYLPSLCTILRVRILYGLETFNDCFCNTSSGAYMIIRV